MTEHTGSGADVLADHLKRCTPADAAIVHQGCSSDETVGMLLAAGWKLDERVDYVLGKRIRFMSAPEVKESPDG